MKTGVRLLTVTAVIVYDYGSFSVGIGSQKGKIIFNVYLNSKKGK